MLAVLAAVTTLVVLVVAGISSGGTRQGKASLAARRVQSARGTPHLVVATAAWRLSVATSRAVAFPVDGHIDVLGGLTASGNSTTPGVLQIDPTTGQSEQVATLAHPVHDAAGAAVGSRYLVFGGGAASVTASVQAFAPDTPVGTPAISVVGQLPAARADLASAEGPGGAVYLAGGYDGANLSPDVLVTRDGTHFAVLARLPVPVRYPAMAVAAGRVWVIGGTASTGESSAVQTIDLRSHVATVAGHLPRPLAHAAAANIGGTIYLFGGRAGTTVLDTIWALNPATGAFHPAGVLPVATSDAALAPLGETVYLVGGEGELSQPQATVMVARLTNGSTPAPAGVAAAPFDGKLLIADRGNNRLLLVDTQKRVLWSFPSARLPSPAQGFYFPDDAFFVKHGTAIITNEEDQDTILELAYPSGQVIASYGHPNVPGRAPGYLSQPDDAYLLQNGEVTVADAKNCRILFLNPDFTFRSAIGSTGACHHDIPNDVAYPNGDTPLADGNFLVSEIYGSYVDEVTQSGQVVWSLKLPIAYPSDPQQLGPDLYLIADYSRPGGVYEFTREGNIVWSYAPPSGEAMLDHPSLAERLPNGYIGVNDDYRHRVVIIDPATSQIVWQYGLTDQAGTGPGQLNTPDGFDLLAPNGASPTHPQTG